MNRRVAMGIGATTGLLIGTAWTIAAMRANGMGLTVECPPGWTPTTAPAIAGITARGACTRPVTPGSQRPIMAVYSTERPAALADRVNADGARAANIVPAGTAALGDPADHESSDSGRLQLISRTLDTREINLEAEVYFLAAGSRFGLLSIVHSPEAEFARPDRTAEWMTTIGGTSPWGSPNAGTLVARCPHGFVAQPNTSPQMIVRCSRGIGTSQFAMISLTLNEGGFGTEEDRTRAAASIAAQVAQAQGSSARVVQAPIPFTLARNVDAIHTKVDTGQRLPVSVRVVSAYSPAGMPDILVFGAGESDLQINGEIAALFERNGFYKRPGPFANVTVARIGAFLLTMIGLVLGRRRSR